MSKQKSKKSKNTTLIVFLVITIVLVIALLLYFFLWKENYQEPKLPVNSSTISDGLCRRSNKSYGGYCTKSGVKKEDCSKKCRQTFGCVAAGYYQNNNCDLFFQTKEAPTCPPGFQSDKGTETTNEDYSGINLNVNPSTCTTFNEIKTEGLCRKLNDSGKYGGYCTKTGVSEEKCSMDCLDTTGCVAAGYFQGNKCDLFFHNKKKPIKLNSNGKEMSTCPSGYKPYAGTSSLSTDYIGHGGKYKDSKTVCTTFKNKKNEQVNSTGLCRESGIEVEVESEVEDAKSCNGWTCDTEGQFCPPSVDGSSETGYCCRNKSWQLGACDKTTKMTWKNGSDAYGVYCYKSGVSENDCSINCLDTAGCIAAGHYQDDKCDLFFQTKEAPTCPDGFQSYQGSSTLDKYKGNGTRFANKHTVCTPFQNRVPKTFIPMDTSSSTVIVNGTKLVIPSIDTSGTGEGCSECLTAMAIIEPTLQVAYKALSIYVDGVTGGYHQTNRIAKEVLKEVLTNLIKSFATGAGRGALQDATGMTESEEKITKWLDDNPGLVNVMKIVSRNGDEKIIAMRLIQASAKILACLLGEGVNATWEVLLGQVHGNFKLSFFVKFMSCVLKVIAQYIVMDVTKCPTFDDCNVKFQLGTEVNKILNTYFENERDFQQMKSESESRELNKMQEGDTWQERVANAFGF